MKIASRSIEDVRDRANIVEVASEFTALRRQGGSYSGLCPFHDENSPSFSVSAEKGLYYCFGCQAGGDAIKLVSQLKNFSFTETIEYLAQRFGVELEYEEQTPGEAQATERRRAAYRALAAAAAYYHKCLKESERAEPARRYLRERGFEDRTLEEFRIGYAPPGGFVRIASRLQIDRRALDDAGLLSSGGRDRFYERITFPISDYRGRVIGFGARALGDAKPKYLNSPETRLFNKRDLLYGFPQVSEAVRKENAALVVEGYTDVLMLHQVGIGNAVATLGTAVTGSHLKRLSSYAENIHLLFDPDEAGEKAIERAAGEAAEMKLDLRVLRLEKDPADWLLEHPAEDFRKLVEDSVPVVEYGIHRIVERTRGSAALDRARARPEIEQMISGISDPILRREAIRLASESLNVEPNFFANLSGSSTSSRRSDRGGVRREYTSREPAHREAARRSPAEQAEREVLALALALPEQAAALMREGIRVEGLKERVVLSPKKDFTEEAHAALYTVLTEHPGASLNELLSDERLTPHLDLVSGLSIESEKLNPTAATARSAWLRLRTFTRDRAKRDTRDIDQKYALLTEIKTLRTAINAEMPTA